MKSEDLKIGETVWVCWPELMVIYPYQVGYKGISEFVPYNFNNIVDVCREIPYDYCAKTPEGAKLLNSYKSLEEKYGKITWRYLKNGRNELYGIDLLVE